jgi:hypothetical protein
VELVLDVELDDVDALDDELVESDDLLSLFVSLLELDESDDLLSPLLELDVDLPFPERLSVL